MDNQFSVGQKVKVIASQTKYDHLFCLTDDMVKEFGGKEVTIDHVSNHIDLDGHFFAPSNHLNPCDNYMYGIKEDGHKYKWSNTMFQVI